MNILIVSLLYGGGYGAGYAAYKESVELANRGHKIYVIHSEKNIKFFKQKNIKNIYINFHKIPILNIILLKRDLDVALSKILSSVNIDLVYNQSLELGLSKFSLFNNIPLIYFIRGTTSGIENNKPEEYWLDQIRRFFITKLLIALEKRILKRANKMIVKSDKMKSELISLYSVKDQKIRIISGGIDLADFPIITKPELTNFRNKKLNFLEKDEKLILFIGRIVPVKGLIYLLKALNNLDQKYNFKLLIVGSSTIGNYQKIIYDYLKHSRIKDKVIFTGYVRQSEVFHYFNACNIVAVPSTYEPFGMVNIQAAAYSKIIVATDVCGSVDLLKNYPKLIITPARNVSQLKRAIIKSFGLSEIKSEYRKHLKQYSWQRVVDCLEREFTENTS